MIEATDVRNSGDGRRRLVWWLAAAAAVAVAAVAFLVVRALSGASENSGVGTIPIAPARTSKPSLFTAARARDTLVGLRVPRGGPVDLTLIPSDQARLPVSAVSVRAGGSPATLRGCGDWCYRFAAPAALHRPLEVVVRVQRPGKPLASATIPLPARLPHSGEGLLRAVDRRMARVRSFRVDESLSSGVSAIRATFEFSAPNRMRYTVSDGSKAVVVGMRRWDSYNGGEWRESPSPGVHVPSYMWDGAGFARLAGRATVGGRPVRVLSAFRPDKQFPAWFRLYVARDDRVIRAEMIAPAHFMRDSLSAFDRPVSIVAPKAGTTPNVWDQMRPIGQGRLYQPGLGSAAAGRPVGGLACTHGGGPEYGAHLELFANERVVVVPAGIGFAQPLRREGAYVRGGRCTYPVRTVEPTGVLHVRAGTPVTLGHLFRLWGQPLSAQRLAGFKARAGERVRAYVGGARWGGPLGAIPLRRHAQIVLEVNGYVPPHTRYRFPPGL